LRSSIVGALFIFKLVCFLKLYERAISDFLRGEGLFNQAFASLIQGDGYYLSMSIGGRADIHKTKFVFIKPSTPLQHFDMLKFLATLTAT
jgi:hypothetical protein